MEPWIQTYTGKAFHLLDPNPNDVDIIDIAHSLSLQCRFNGHANHFYSVAEHSVLVSEALEAAGHEEEEVLWGLMHDAAEAYVGDITRPLKRQLPDFKVIEDRLVDAIVQALQLPVVPGDATKMADSRILLNERAALMQYVRPWHHSIEDLEPLPDTIITGWSPLEGERRFLRRFREFWA